MTTGRKTIEQGNIKKRVGQIGRDKEESLEWLRKGQLNWYGERIIINAQDQGHYMNGFIKNGRTQPIGQV